MTKININKTELVWPGKYDDSGQLKEIERVNLPFQVIETVNETRATKEARKERHPSLFDLWEAKEGDSFEEGWKNKLIWGENLLVMSSLLDKFAGKFDLIYIDPPFYSGRTFKYEVGVGSTGHIVDETRIRSIIEEKSYRDTWNKGLDSYLGMLYERLVLLRDLLSENGTLVVHLDWHVSHYVKLILDEIFGYDYFLNNVVWKRSTPTGRKGMKKLPRDYDDILFYSKGQDSIYSKTYLPYSEEYIKKFFTKVEEDGRRYMLQTVGDYSRENIKRFRKEGRIVETRTGNLRLKQYLDESKGVMLDDIWTDILNVRQKGVRYMHDREYLGFETQKPIELLKRIIKLTTKKNSLVGDFFVGCGSTLVAAEETFDNNNKAPRRWIGCDFSRFAIHLARKRLLETENCNRFEILNLGKYERKYWQGVTFGLTKKHNQQLAIFEYLKFILKLYGAEPLSGMEHLHGKKGMAVVHVGAVDAPVTIDEINSCIDECIALKQKELHVLGWEWEMGLYELLPEAAKGRGIKLILFQIPREVMEQEAIEKGGIHFFELAYLAAEIRIDGHKVTVELKDFVIPNAELIPEDIREKIKKWSDYIDYWAIDWDFQNDTFMQGWVDYRTRKDRKLSLKSDVHKYEKEGNYTIMVKVIDIFGNDTSQTFEKEVK